MKENSDIFLVAGDPLAYLAEPMHKKYSATFVWGLPFSTYVSFDSFFQPPPPVHICTHFGCPPPFPHLCTYVMEGLFLNQKVNKNIRISCLLKYKHSKKNS